MRSRSQSCARCMRSRWMSASSWVRLWVLYWANLFHLLNEAHFIKTRLGVSNLLIVLTTCRFLTLNIGILHETLFHDTRTLWLVKADSTALSWAHLFETINKIFNLRAHLINRLLRHMIEAGHCESLASESFISWNLASTWVEQVCEIESVWRNVTRRVNMSTQKWQGALRMTVIHLRSEFFLSI